MTAKIRIDGSFKITHLKPGAHTFLIPLDDECAKLIGQIVVYWGAFEIRMDLLTRTIATGMEWPIEIGWERQTFKKRKALFKSIMRKYTSQMFPSEITTFDKIAARAGELHWRRNLVAHGYYEATPDGKLDADGAQGISYTAHTDWNKKHRDLPITAEVLERLWHDISHLNGELLCAINRMGGRVSALDLVLPDKDLLQDQQSGNFRLLAISERF